MRRRNGAWMERGGQAVIAGLASPLVRRSHTIITGTENIPEGVPTVFMPFHDDWFNPFFHGVLLRKQTKGLWVITAKNEINKPVLGPFLHALGCEFIVRRRGETVTPEERREYIRIRYESQARRTARMPKNRGIIMNFPEGTRHDELTQIYAGAVALGGCLAVEHGSSMPVLTVGAAQAKFSDLTRNIIKLHGGQGNHRAAMHISESLWLGSDVMDRYIELGPDGISPEVEQVRSSLELSQNTARANVGLSPLTYIGKVPTKRERNERI